MKTSGSLESARTWWVLSSKKNKCFHRLPTYIVTSQPALPSSIMFPLPTHFKYSILYMVRHKTRLRRKAQNEESLENQSWAPVPLETVELTNAARQSFSYPFFSNWFHGFVYLEIIHNVMWMKLFLLSFLQASGYWWPPEVGLICIRVRVFTLMDLR